MTDLTTPPLGAAIPKSGVSVRVVFTATICLSALLLFLIQPMFAKMALPLLGGAPNVWTTAMLFFQAVLLAGYAYAHWLGTRASLRTQIITHVSITLIASLSLPIAIAAGWNPPTSGDATLWLLGLFAVSLGAPFFALSANAPLLQKWYAATGGDDADDPYFLYAASNIGSFGALMAYPFILEPMLGASAQSQTWTFGYFFLAIGLIACGWIASQNSTTAVAARTRNDIKPTAKPSMREIAVWIGLAFLPSSLMLSITTKISTDIGSFPLIWTVTLALYLLSYVFAFSERLRPPATIMRVVNGILVILTIGLTLQHMNHLGNLMLMLLCALLFSVALTCHSALAERRPAEAHLTRFYLAMSVGGALGGLVNSIIAPLIFNDVYEFPLVLAFTLLAAPAAATRIEVPEFLRRIAPVLGICGAVIAASVVLLMTGMPAPVALTLPAIAAFAVFFGNLRTPFGQTVLAVSLVVISLTFQTTSDTTVKQRSFFGVYKVMTDVENNVRKIAHGTTVHGVQRLTGDVLTPMSYYHYATPLGQVAQARAKDARVAVVGLGAGGLACYHKGHVDWTFYEIDPLVEKIARDPSQFTYMSECANDAPTLLGDARLRMMEAEAGAFDLILLDAFSSDAVPVHLLTVEAMQVYRDKLADDGVLAIHISNRFFDLKRPIAKVAETLGMPIRFQKFKPNDAQSEAGALQSDALLVAKTTEALGAFTSDARWETVEPAEGAVWTDDYANVLSVLR